MLFNPALRKHFSVRQSTYKNTPNENLMTKDEILYKTTWDDYGSGTCLIFVNLFNKEIPFVIFQDHQAAPDITDKMCKCINEVLLLDKAELETIKNMLWEECHFAFTVADYGFEPKGGETHLEAHLRGFGISNKEEDAYLKSEVKEIQYCPRK